MLKLCGFSMSNYYNQVKLQLIEKGIAFEEDTVFVGPRAAPDLLLRSPLGKVPFLETEQGTLTESAVIADYIEQAYPEHSLMPTDAFAAAKVRELVKYIELYLELPARELYPQAFFGGQVSDSTKERVAKQLAKGVEGYKKIMQLNPYQYGDQFTLADCSAVIHLPVVSMAAKLVLGVDLFEGTSVKDYLKTMSARPAVQKVAADRKTSTEQMMAASKK